MNRNSVAGGGEISGAPRMRGDEPVYLAMLERRNMCSPHARG